MARVGQRSHIDRISTEMANCWHQSLSVGFTFGDSIRQRVAALREARLPQGPVASESTERRLDVILSPDVV